jgi:hypothetical protein
MIEPGRISIADNLDGGQMRTACARLHLAPRVNPRQATPSGNVILRLDRHSIELSADTTMCVTDSAWHSGFGRSTPSHCIELPIANRHCAMTLIET